MTEAEFQKPSEHPSGEIGIRQILATLSDWWRYLLKKWLIICLFGIIGGLLGLVYAFKQKMIYTASLNFALEDDKSGGMSLGGALGLANSLGIDLGTSAGGAFGGANLIELMRSRKVVEKALLNPITIKNKQISLADYYIQFNELNKGWEEKPELKSVAYPVSADRSTYTLQQDSVLGAIYSSMVGPNAELKVAQKDKKISIITIEVKAADELFAKTFAESVAREISELYVETKSKKARMNVDILQRQTDSVRRELNDAISGVASSTDNTFNLNPALNIKRVPSSKRQIDVQANTAILTQLVTNLELAKVTLLKETPLIQVIDRPILPLKKERPSKFFSMIKGGLLGGFLILFMLVVRRIFLRFNAENSREAIQ